jgi:hypothetical protein
LAAKDNTTIKTPPLGTNLNGGGVFIMDNCCIAAGFCCHGSAAMLIVCGAVFMSALNQLQML